MEVGNIKGIEEGSNWTILIIFIVAFIIIGSVLWAINNIRVVEEEGFLEVKVHPMNETKETWISIKNYYKRDLMIEVQFKQWKEATPEDAEPPTIILTTQEGENASKVRTALSVGNTLAIKLELNTNDINFHSGYLVIKVDGYATMSGGKSLVESEDEKYVNYLG